VGDDGGVTDTAAVVTIRRAVQDDDAALLELDQSAWSAESGFPSMTKPGRETFFDERAKPELHLVALYGERLVGYVRVREKYPFEEGAGVFGIFGLAVSPDARRLGVGSALLDAAEAEARRRGGRKLCLNVFGSNESARRLYERHGFVVEGHSRAEFVIEGALVDDFSLTKFL
jgi:ribosomal protein S18 acetylase RimI-like enzyme